MKTKSELFKRLEKSDQEMIAWNSRALASRGEEDSVKYSQTNSDRPDGLDGIGGLVV